MDQSKVQFTVDTKLKNKFEEAIYPLDMSNAFRLFMNDVIKGDTKLGLSNATTYPMVDEETERGIAESMKDLEEGRYTVLKTKEDIKNHFNRLAKEVENE